MKKAGLGGRLGSIALSLAVLLKEHNETDTGTEDDINYLKNKERLGISQYPELENIKALLKALLCSGLKCKVNGMKL